MIPTSVKIGNYILTTEHAASSYGRPVLVDGRGIAYGMTDIVRDNSGDSGFRTARMVVRDWVKSHDKGILIDPAIHAFAGTGDPLF